VVLIRKHPSLGCFLDGSGKCDSPDPHIFNGLAPSKMPAPPEPGSFSFVSEQKRAGYSIALMAASTLKGIEQI
jgi:hypothetical protein